jgi:protein involved in polysaccharide export with SLBB domain
MDIRLWQGMNRFSKNVMFFFLVIFVFGCQTVPVAENMTVPVAKPQSEVRLSPGDVIQIKFPYAAQFDDTQTILPNGRIILPLVDEVVASGKSPMELQKELINMYSVHLQHPDLSVIVRSLFRQKVYVEGEVNRPGLIELSGRLTVLEAIIQAGGFKMDSAKREGTILIRQENGAPKAYSLDLAQGVDENNPWSPVYLEPGDIVFVPRTIIVNVDVWVAQHIYDLLPKVGFNYPLN